MKKAFILPIILLFSFQVFSQEIYFAPGYSIGGYDHFKSAINYRVGYHIFIKEKGRTGLSFSHDYNNQPFSYTFSSNSDGMEYNRSVNASNHRLEFSVNYCWNVLNSSKSSLFIGPEIGLNFFLINENGTEQVNNEPEIYNFDQRYWEKSKIGLGLVFDYDIRLVIEYLKLFVSLKPEVIFLSGFGQKGYSGQVFVGNLNTNIGFKLDIDELKLNRNKKSTVPE